MVEHLNEVAQPAGQEEHHHPTYDVVSVPEGPYNVTTDSKSGLNRQCHKNVLKNQYSKRFDTHKTSSSNNNRKRPLLPFSSRGGFSAHKMTDRGGRITCKPRH
jgi:hypothetical protein